LKAYTNTGLPRATRRAENLAFDGQVDLRVRLSKRECPQPV